VKIGLGCDDGPPRAPDASGVSAASLSPFYFAWGCFRDFVPGACGVPPKRCARDTRSLVLRATPPNPALGPRDHPAGHGKRHPRGGGV